MIRGDQIIQGIMRYAESDERWKDDAKCNPERCNLGPEFFYPGTDREKSDAVRGFCEGCKVRQECLAYAMENHLQFGMWGGTCERERRRLRKAGWRSKPPMDRPNTSYPGSKSTGTEG